MSSLSIKLSVLAILGLLFLPRGPRAMPAQIAADLPVDEALAGDSVIVDWFMLGDLNYETGFVGGELKPFIGKDVMIPGFIVPLEDFANSASEFLLVPYVGACVHTPAPPPNQLVSVKIRGDRKVTFGLWEPIWLHGELLVEQTTSVFGPSGFFVHGDSITPYEAW